MPAAGPGGLPRTFRLHHSAGGGLATDTAGAVLHADDELELTAVLGADSCNFRIYKFLNLKIFRC